MSDLTLTEQKHVRTALRYLRRRIGTWAAVSDAVKMAPKSLENVMAGRTITASLALRVARVLDASFDDLLAGHFLPGACPRCGYVPDFADEETVSREAPHAAPEGLRLVR